jgi:hypothetical protein
VDTGAPDQQKHQDRNAGGPFRQKINSNKHFLGLAILTDPLADQQRWSTRGYDARKRDGRATANNGWVDDVASMATGHTERQRTESPLGRRQINGQIGMPQVFDPNAVIQFIDPKASIEPRYIPLRLPGII